MQPHRRRDKLSDLDREEYINALGALRHVITRKCVKVHPTSEDYQRLQEDLETLDRMQERWTGDPEFFWHKDATCYQFPGLP